MWRSWVSARMREKHTLTPWKIIAFRLSRILLISYVLTIGIFYQIQDFLIFPGHYLRAAAVTQGQLSPGAQLIELRARDGQTIKCLFGSALDAAGSACDDASHRPTVLYFYGNDGGISCSLAQFEEFRRLGCNVLVPEFVGYGISSAAASEAAIY